MGLCWRPCRRVRVFLFPVLGLGRITTSSAIFCSLSDFRAAGTFVLDADLDLVLPEALDGSGGGDGHGGKPILMASFAVAW
jgi:hypothetical protein